MSKKDFMAVAEAAGVAVDYTPGGRDRWSGESYPFYIMLDAPEGKLFRSSGCHCDGSIQGDEGTTRTDWRRALSDLREILGHGPGRLRRPGL